MAGLSLLLGFAAAGLVAARALLRPRVMATDIPPEALPPWLKRVVDGADVLDAYVAPARNTYVVWVDRADGGPSRETEYSARTHRPLTDRERLRRLPGRRAVRLPQGLRAELGYRFDEHARLIETVSVSKGGEPLHACEWPYFLTLAAQRERPGEFRRLAPAARTAEAALAYAAKPEAEKVEDWAARLREERRWQADAGQNADLVLERFPARLARADARAGELLKPIVQRLAELESREPDELWRALRAGETGSA